MVTRRHFLGGSAGAVGLAMGAAASAQNAGAADDWPVDPPFRFTGDMDNFDAAQSALADAASVDVFVPGDEVGFPEAGPDPGIPGSGG